MDVWDVGSLVHTPYGVGRVRSFSSMLKSAQVYLGAKREPRQIPLSRIRPATPAEIAASPFSERSASTSREGQLWYRWAQ